MVTNCTATGCLTCVRVVKSPPPCTRRCTQEKNTHACSELPWGCFQFVFGSRRVGSWKAGISCLWQWRGLDV